MMAGRGPFAEDRGVINLTQESSHGHRCRQPHRLRQPAPFEHGPVKTRDIAPEHNFDVVAESFVELADKLGC
jgi:hypothetical protein